MHNSQQSQLRYLELHKLVSGRALFLESFKLHDDTLTGHRRPAPLCRADVGCRKCTRIPIIAPSHRTVGNANPAGPSRPVVHRHPPRPYQRLHQTHQKPADKAPRNHTNPNPAHLSKKPIRAPRAVRSQQAATTTKRGPYLHRQGILEALRIYLLRNNIVGRGSDPRRRGSSIEQATR